MIHFDQVTVQNSHLHRRYSADFIADFEEEVSR